MVEKEQLLGIAPYFLVRDLADSLNYYCNVLGFDRPKLWGQPPEFAMPRRDGCIVMLQQAPPDATFVANGSRPGYYWDAYLWITNADALFAEFAARGALFKYEVCIQELYDMKEFAVRDPDGYVLAFGQHYDASSA